MKYEQAKPTIDLEKIKESFDRDEVLLEEISRELIDKGYAHKIIKLIEESIQNKDSETLRKEAHRLKGSLSYFISILCLY